MDIIHENTIFELTPETINEVRKSYDFFKPERIDEAVNLLESWIEKEEHFVNKKYSKDYLERLIISCKGSVERAKKQIDKLCTFRTLMPTFFEKCNARKELSHITDLGQIVFLPKLTKSLYRIGILKTMDETENVIFMDFYRYMFSMLEYLKAHDYSLGFVLVLDYTTCNMFKLIQNMNITELRQALIITMQGYEIAVKAIHIITSSTFAEAYVKILKQILTKKLGDRIVLHKTRETLFNSLPKNIFPIEYGGNEKSILDLNEITLDALSSEDHVNYLKTCKEYKTAEKYRFQMKSDEEYLGISGTFRTLSID